MKLITFDLNDMVIYSRILNEAPNVDLVKSENFDLGQFYLAHNNGMDYIQMTGSELLFFIQFAYAMDTFDLSEFGFEDVLNSNFDIYFAVEFNGVRELRSFKYSDYKTGDHIIKSLSHLITCYEAGAFKDGLNINRITAL